MQASGGLAAVTIQQRNSLHPHRQEELQQLEVAAERRFFAHRSLRRLGTLDIGAGDDSGRGSHRSPWQPQALRYATAVSDRRKAKHTSGMRHVDHKNHRVDDNEESARSESRRFLTLSGRSSTIQSSTTAPVAQPRAMRQQQQQRSDGHSSAEGTDGLFLKPQTPVSVSRELRSSLLAYEDSGLMLKSFWMPEENMLNEETKTAKDQSAPLYKHRDLQQLSDAGESGGDGGGRGAGGGVSVRGTSGCVIVGTVPGSEARVGQNGRPLNLRSAWSDTPELRRQRRLGYHALRSAGKPTDSGVHLSWRSQLQDPYVKVIECSNSSNVRRIGAPDEQKTIGRPPRQALVSEMSASSAEREAVVLNRVRSGSSGFARSPLKASAMFYAKRFSRALGNRFLSVEGTEPGLPVRYGDLMQCLQERQRLLIVQSLQPPDADDEADRTVVKRQQALPRLEKKTAAAAKDAQATSASQSAPLEAAHEHGATSSGGSGGGRQPVAAGQPQSRKQPAISASAGRIALGRSLSKSAPSKAASRQQSFVPIVTPLAGRPRRSRDVAPAVAAAASAASNSAITIDASVDADDEAAVNAHPSTPQPSTPKGGEPLEAPTVVSSASAAAAPAAVEPTPDGPAAEGIWVPVMPLGEDADTDADADADAIGSMRVISRASLTSTHFSVGGGGAAGENEGYAAGEEADEQQLLTER